MHGMENVKEKKWSSVYRKLAPVNRHGILYSSLASLLKSCPHFIPFIASRPLFFAQCTLHWLLRSGVQYFYISLSLLVFFVLAYWCDVSECKLQMWKSCGSDCYIVTCQSWTYTFIVYILQSSITVAVRSKCFVMLLLDYWDRGFESRWGHECSSLVFVCCESSCLWHELITLSGECYRVCVCFC